jgi:hypothetical protein
MAGSLFYQDTLLAYATDVKLVKWSGLTNPDMPVLFHGCATKEDTVDEGAVSEKLFVDG